MIPDDIRKAAEAVFRHAVDLNPNHIARALMNERERCALVAENNDAFPQEGAAIAADIRRGDNPGA